VGRLARRVGKIARIGGGTCGVLVSDFAHAETSARGYAPYGSEFVASGRAGAMPTLRRRPYVAADCHFSHGMHRRSANSTKP
jgi:hypothetical protein